MRTAAALAIVLTISSGLINASEPSAVVGGIAGNAPAAKVSLGARTVAIPVPAWVIGSYDGSGRANMMTASWTGICNSRPPCIAVSLRPATYTHGNITASGAFTVNVPSVGHAAEVAYFGTVSGRDVDKLEATGMTAVRGDSVDAPYLAEFPLVFECRVVETVELGSHTMFIGRIVDVKADPAVIAENGAPDIMKIEPFVYHPGGGRFHRTAESIGDVRSLSERIGK